jgi:hypothetical protein
VSGNASLKPIGCSWSYLACRTGCFGVGRSRPLSRFLMVDVAVEWYACSALCAGGGVGGRTGAVGGAAADAVPGGGAGAALEHQEEGGHPRRVPAHAQDARARRGARLPWVPERQFRSRACSCRHEPTHAGSRCSQTVLGAVRLSACLSVCLSVCIHTRLWGVRLSACLSAATASWPRRCLGETVSRLKRCPSRLPSHPSACVHLCAYDGLLLIGGACACQPGPLLVYLFPCRLMGRSEHHLDPRNPSCLHNIPSRGHSPEVQHTSRPQAHH